MKSERYVLNTYELSIDLLVPSQARRRGRFHAAYAQQDFQKRCKDADMGSAPKQAVSGLREGTGDVDCKASNRAALPCFRADGCR